MKYKLPSQFNEGRFEVEVVILREKMEVEQWCIETGNSTKALHTGVLVINITEEHGPGLCCFGYTVATILSASTVELHRSLLNLAGMCSCTNLTGQSTEPRST